MTFDDGIRAERAAARDAALIAESLAAQSWPMAGGHLVLTGDGFYVNRAMGVAIGEEIGDADLDLVERECRASDAPPRSRPRRGRTRRS